MFSKKCLNNHQNSTSSERLTLHCCPVILLPNVDTTLALLQNWETLKAFATFPAFLPVVFSKLTPVYHFHHPFYKVKHQYFKNFLWDNYLVELNDFCIFRLVLVWPISQILFELSIFLRSRDIEGNVTSSLTRARWWKCHTMFTFWIHMAIHKTWDVDI